MDSSTRRAPSTIPAEPNIDAETRVRTALSTQASLILTFDQTRARAARLLAARYDLAQLLIATAQLIGETALNFDARRCEGNIMRSIITTHLRSPHGVGLVLSTFADYADQHGDTAGDLAVVLLAPINDWPKSLVLEPALARLTPSVFHDAFYPGLPFDKFLRRNVLRKASGLSTEQKAFGLMLVPDWEGTLLTLLDTIHTLHPDCP
jgi:hypothetical protein